MGSAWAAITFVNALATGVGSAAAIELALRADVELETGPGSALELEIPGASDSPVARASLSKAIGEFGPSSIRRARLHVDSGIPPRKGLKSSSALTVAIARAVASASGRLLSAAEAARFSADASLEAGVSATGAFDDAAASSLGGIVVTVNAERRLLRHDSLDPHWLCLLWIPPGDHAPAPEWLPTFRAHAAEGRPAEVAARSGRYVPAMERNTEFVETLLGLEYATVRRDLRRAGAIASGVSGLGPTLATLLRVEHETAVRDVLKQLPGEIRTTRFVEPGKTIEPSAVKA
ncbi:MAG: shikimate kinase [Thermoplasmata archaeon]|nr:shikimate kinase [Thermoplasmata archaeon]